MKVHGLFVAIEKDEDNCYLASCPALQGCYTQGGTFDQALGMIKDAIELNIESRLDRGESIPDKYQYSDSDWYLA